MIVCPACGSRKVTAVRSFPTLAEPTRSGEAPVSTGIVIRHCDKCRVEFPSVVSRKKCSLVPEKEIQRLNKELVKMQEENKGLREGLNELTRRQAEAHENLIDVRVSGELNLAKGKLGILEEELNYLRGEKRQLEWLFSTLQLTIPPKQTPE